MVWIDLEDTLHKQVLIDSVYMPDAGCGSGYGGGGGQIPVDERLAPLIQELWYGLQKRNEDGDLVDYCRTYASCQGDGEADYVEHDDGCGYIMVQWSWRYRARRVVRRMCGPVVEMYDCGNAYWPPRTWAYIRFQWKVGT